MLISKSLAELHTATRPSHYALQVMVPLANDTMSFLFWDNSPRLTN